MKNKNNKAKLAVLMGNTIFGFSFLFSKLAMMVTIPTVLIACRFTVAFLVLNLIVIIGKSRGWISFSLKNKPTRQVLLLALIQPVIYFVAENYGILYTSSAFAGVIIAVIPIAGVICDVLIMRAKVSLKQILCAVGSVVGVIITTIGAKDMTSSVKGTIFLMVAVLAGALFFVYSKKAGENYNAIERTYVMFGVGSLVYVIIALIQCRGAYDTLIMNALVTPSFWISILYLSVVSSVLAFLFLNYGSSHVSVSEGTIFANFTTVISIIAGVLILHESFTIQQVIGVILILICVYIAR